MTTEATTDTNEAWLARWRELASRELKGAPLERLISRTAEGLAVEPLFPGDPTALPGRELLLARAGFVICPEYAPAAAGATIAADLRRGAGAVWLRGHERVSERLEGVDLMLTPVVIAAGAEGRAAASSLLATASAREVPRAALHGAIGCDPLAALATDGSIAWPIEQALTDMSEVAGALQGTGLRTALVDVGAYHEAGATATDQLAALLATGVAYLRALTAGGLTTAAACGQLVFAMAVGRDLFLEIAKLRAARLCWARVAAACGVDGATMRLHARGSWRERTIINPWTGLLRGTGETFAAAVGGADTIATTPMDAAIGEPAELGRRMAINTGLILAEESRLAHVTDPAGGSGYVEALTDRLARAAWTRFQAIEAAGGVLAGLRSGEIQRSVEAAAQAQTQAVASVRVPIVGVSRFAAPAEPVTGATPAEATTPATGGEQVTPLVRARLAAPFEALRAAGDAHAAKHGAPEAVTLVAVGPPAQWRGRVEFCRAYFGVAGLAVHETEGSEHIEEAARQFAATGARAAVICSADPLYPTVVPALAPLLRAAGARVVLLAGRPKDSAAALAAAGVDLFVQLGGDAVALLTDLQARLEVRA
ncbi:MAG: methylmalonyl-CoA mutase [Myxococcales bacterium]|nr:methylmalonyl-CoA mutase [Myxococcales bacterium]